MLKHIVPTFAAAVLLFGCAHAHAGEPQPHMRDALAHLKEAREQLEKASHDKGGHRAKALELVDAAIAETQQGIQFDNQH